MKTDLHISLKQVSGGQSQLFPVWRSLYFNIAN